MVASLHTGAKAPVLVIDDNAYTLRDGVLLHSYVTPQGVVEGLRYSQQWTQVDNFELEPETQQQIDRAFTVLLSLDTQESLTRELQAWEDRERMNPLRMCAQERLDTRALNSDQLYYLQRFVQRWDRCAAEGLFNHNAWLGQNELLAREGEAS